MNLALEELHQQIEQQHIIFNLRSQKILVFKWFNSYLYGMSTDNGQGRKVQYIIEFIKVFIPENSWWTGCVKQATLGNVISIFYYLNSVLNNHDDNAEPRRATLLDITPSEKYLSFSLCLCLRDCWHTGRHEIRWFSLF